MRQSFLLKNPRLRWYTPSAAEDFGKKIPAQIKLGGDFRVLDCSFPG